MEVTKFLENVRKIVETNPTYRTGGDGSDGTCDCVGLIMGALGGKFDLHSSNYFAREQMRSLDALVDESQLHTGSIVYKSRRDTGQLNERYKSGGRYYKKNDLLDYYHVGVVTGIDPLEITHCTSTGAVDGITTDSSIRAWSHFGDLLKVEYDSVGEDPQQPPTAYDLAVVYSEDGNPVKMRQTPSTRLDYIAKVPAGAQVEVLESADGWSAIRWNGQRGYMMSQFLRVIGTAEPEPEPPQAEVTITLSASAAYELYKALSGVL